MVAYTSRIIMQAIPARVIGTSGAQGERGETERKVFFLLMCWDNLSTVNDFGRISGLSLDIINCELIQYSRHNLPINHRFLEDHVILRSVPVELLTQLEISVLAFKAADVYDIHHPHSTGALHFRNQCRRIDWIWVQAGTEEIYSGLRGRPPAKLVAL